MHPLETIRNLLFMMWRRRPFLLAVVMITTVILLVLQYQSITTGDSNHVQAKSYSSAFSSIRAEAVVLRDHPRDLEYRFDGENGIDAAQQYNQPVNIVDQSKTSKATSSYRSTSPSKVEGQMRLVHFDLKGAPPKIEYILKILPLLKAAGANGESFLSIPLSVLPSTTLIFYASSI